MRPVRILAALAAVLMLGGCHKAAHVESPNWAPDVKKALNDFMDEFAGRKGAYVVFDFDHTSCIFDIQDQMALHQLRTMSFPLTPEQFETSLATNGFDDAASLYRQLYTQYGPFTAEGLDSEAQERIQSTPLWQAFASEMLRVVDECGEPGWMLDWLSGFTQDELYKMSHDSHSTYWKVPTQVATLSPTWTDGIGVTDEVRELWKTLMANKIDVWVCSASEINQVRAAVDVFGLHDCCRGAVAMTLEADSLGRFTTTYDFGGHAWLTTADGWQEDTTYEVGTRTAKEGKVTAITNAIAPRYGGKGPSAGFMDSTGDFNFCTEFASLRLVMCFNRADRKVTDGGGLIAEVALWQRDSLGYDLRKAGRAGDTFYILQGRDENGLRSLIPSNSSYILGSTEQRTFANEDNHAQLAAFSGMTTKEVLEKYCIRTSSEDSELGFSYGWLDSYNGYHSR